MLAQRPEQEAHDKDRASFDYNPDRIRIWKCWFSFRGERKIGARTGTNIKLNLNMTPSPGIEPEPHWWEQGWRSSENTRLPTFVQFSSDSFFTILISTNTFPRSRSLALLFTSERK